mmetsp:Transcript_47442/g.75422  ORF Transcript_47442/g.75422 Transcript_47442/m.75422 type:complete len:113 (-) Transcript_47442:532-870(-)
MQSAIEMQVKSMARTEKMHTFRTTKRHMLTVESEMKDWLELQGRWSLCLAELKCQQLCLAEAQDLLIFRCPDLDSPVYIPRSTKVSPIAGMKQVLQIQLMVPVCWAPRPASS